MQIYRIVTLPLLVSCFLLGGINGKLSGRITDTSGHPLTGVNVYFLDSELGTATDDFGEYTLLNIPPGTYTVSYRLIGYRTHSVEALQIRSDLTTRQDVQLLVTVLESDQPIVVRAERPLIQPDLTARTVHLSAEEIVDMPVDDFKDVLITRAGFTEDENGGIHVRGGRTREILYMVDGIPVEDPLSGDFSGTVSQNAIQELNIISGTFNAEYGEAMSAVVNLITREGHDQSTAKIELMSAPVEDSPYHQRFAFGVVKDSTFQHINLRQRLYDYYQDNQSDYPGSFLPMFKLPTTGELSVNWGGRLPELPLSLFVSGYYTGVESPLPNGAVLTQDHLAKLTWGVNPQTKVSARIHSTQSLIQRYKHRWKYLPQNQVHTFRTHDQWAITLNHAPDAHRYFLLSYASTRSAELTRVQAKSPEDYERPETKDVYFYISGDEGEYTNNQTVNELISGEFTWQIHPRHQIKSGASCNWYDLDIFHMEDPWDDGTQFQDDTTFTPVEGAFYLQDKMEFDYMILNLGVRFDYIDPRAEMWRDIRYFVVMDTISGEFVPAPLTDVDPRSQWSPRIGIAYPVSDRTVFHLSYGHFFQNPAFDALTYNARKDLSAVLPLVGNPRVKAQKTIAFETGLRSALSPSVALEFTAWMKDIRDLLSTTQMRYRSQQYVVYTNSDYASVKGMDITVASRPGEGLSGSFTYTYSVAKGNNSQPLAGFFSAYEQEEVPHQEYYLDFDQRHDFALNLQLNYADKGKSWILNQARNGKWQVNLLANAASGLPYTPFVDPVVRVEPNSARKPWTFTLDLRLQRSMPLPSGKLNAYLDIRNATDYENVRYVFSRTGKPFDSGGIGLDTSLDADHNPAAVGPGREIRIGLSWEY